MIPPRDEDMVSNVTNIRYGFGKNWRRYLASLTEERIKEAEHSVSQVLGTLSLRGKSFVDVGSGSGLFSLSAARLGASRVHSFDFDPDSVACTVTLRERFAKELCHWTVEQGDALNEGYLKGLGQWDVVYSWGVLHHTGQMWKALENVSTLCKPGGMLVVSLYNDQGARSTLWAKVKRAVNTSTLARYLIYALCIPVFALGALVRDVMRFQNPLARYRVHQRGMSPLTDWLDWIGGYPFEVARPDDVVAFFQARHFVIQRMNTCGRRLGCNEFIFSKQ
jgi:2-polyprenyl-3-methyl-5-hydroxy-6-metoxy-1,4-benzoquinol methylase